MSYERMRQPESEVLGNTPELTDTPKEIKPKENKPRIGDGLRKTLAALGITVQLLRGETRAHAEPIVDDPHGETEQHKMERQRLEGLLNHERLPSARLRKWNQTQKQFSSREEKLPTDRKVEVINIWASWCSPCLKELPKFAEVGEKLHDAGIETYFITEYLESDSKGYAEVVGEAFRGSKNAQDKIYSGNLKELLERLLSKKMRGEVQQLGLPITIVAYDGEMKVRLTSMSDETLDYFAAGLIEKYGKKGKK